MTPNLLPNLPGFVLGDICLHEDVITLLAHSSTVSASCPTCHHPSSTVHGYYQRTLADLPWSGHPVRLRLTIRRFCCQHSDCPRKTFADPILALAERYARRTTRLTGIMEHLSVALGGQAGSRLAQHLGMTSSPDTLLRLLRRLPDEPIVPPRVVSVDDWSWRRGQRYGTLICDLERHRRLDVLPQRDALSVAAWLKRYPSIAIISRDRSGEYAEAARLGAPQAIQVADRFHLAQNFRETIERVVRRRFADIHHLFAPAQPLILGEDLPLKRDDAAKVATQRRRMARYERVNLLHEQGYSRAQIALYLGLTQQTVQQDLLGPPRPSVYKPQQGKLIPYKPYVHQRFFQEGCRNAVQIYREIHGQGYPGSSTVVVNYITQLRQLIGEPSAAGPVMRTKPTPVKGMVPSPRAMAWWFYLPPDQLTQKQHEYLHILQEADQELNALYTHAQAFAQIIRCHSSVVLTAWMEDAGQGASPEMRGFVRGLRGDEAAVRAGLDLPWSQGQMEGQMNRLKLIKRQGYGRAKLAVLRQRILHTS